MTQDRNRRQNFQPTKGRNNKDELQARYQRAFAREDGKAMQAIAEQLLAWAGNMESGDEKDQQMINGLHALTTAFLYQNDGKKAQSTIDSLRPLINRIEDPEKKARELCRMFLLSGYTELAEGSAEYVVLAGEQLVETAVRLQEIDRIQMTNCGLTLQIYGYLHDTNPETALAKVDEKIALVQEHFPAGVGYNLAMQTALQLKISGLLSQERYEDARQVVEQLQGITPNSSDALVSSSFIDLATGNSSQAYATALELFNQSLVNNVFDHAQMILLQHAAHECGKENEYQGYVALAKSRGLIRADDTTYDPIGDNISAERADQLKDVIGKYSRSGLFTTNQVTRPINSDAAHVAGLRSTPADQYRRNQGGNSFKRE